MKKKSIDCFCALCRTPRKLLYSRHLTSMHYVQIFILALVFVTATYPWLAWKGVGALPIIWGLFESIHKSLYRKDLQCPHCGFDPKWYKKDVKFARQKVEEFLKQNPDNMLNRKSRDQETIFNRYN